MTLLLPPGSNWSQLEPKTHAEDAVERRYFYYAEEGSERDLTGASFQLESLWFPHILHDLPPSRSSQADVAAPIAFLAFLVQLKYNINRGVDFDWLAIQ
jgi:hypothetical protein